MDEWDGGDEMTTMLGRAAECAPLYGAALELGPVRRWRSLRLLTRLYGAEVVRYIRVARGPLDALDGGDDAARWFLADPQRLHDASRRVPLRQSGACDDARRRDRESLRSVLQRISRV
ncbi:hypothetical protein ATM99_08320 [Cellulomonas sp. B6]|nr:hypothetical protein ATM99_08320 [Cellulomonas sp. B6]